MADKKAEITPLNLNGSINLNKMKSEIMDYTSGSFNHKNSLYYNNVITNWYKNTIPKDVYKQYNGKPIYVDGPYVTYDGATYQIPGAKVEIEEIDYTPKQEMLYVKNGQIYANDSPIASMPYAGYLSISKPAKNTWIVSVIPYAPMSILDFVTFILTVTDYGSRIIIGGVEKVNACLVHAETGYGVYVTKLNFVAPDVKFGYVDKTGTTVDKLFSNCETVKIQFGTFTYSAGVNTEPLDAGNYHANFTILATKHYIQCTFDEGIEQWSSKTIFVRNTGFFAPGYINLNNDRSTALFGTTSTYHKGYRRDILLTTDGNKAWWSGGVKVPLLDSNKMYIFDVVYNYSGVIEGISFNNSWLTRDVDEIIGVDTEMTNSGVIDYYTIIYKYKDKYYKVKRYTNWLNKNCYLVKNFLCYETDSYENTIDLNAGKILCRSDDYNNRLLPIFHNPSPSAFGTRGEKDNQLYSKSDYYCICEQNALGSSSNLSLHFELKNNTVIPMLYASGVNEMYYADNLVNPSTIEAPISISLVSTEDNFSKSIKSISGINVFDRNFNANIDMFIPNTFGGVPVYFGSFGGKAISPSLSYGVTAYPMDANSNSLYNLTVLDKIVDTYLNQCIITTQNYSTFTVMDNKLNPVLAYYLLSMVEFSNVFIMQGTYYASSGDYIIRLTLTNGVVSGTDVIANIKDLQFIGSTTNEAYFYSLFDRSIYKFTGDFNLSKEIEVTSISEIYKSYNNPAIGLIAVTTNAGLIVMYQGQICLIEDSNDPEVYYDDKCIINNKNRYSLDERDNFIKTPIILETELYGMGSEIKSINDCVYIRLYSDDLVGGSVKVTSRTINEISRKAETKEIKINPGSWDKESGTMFIRYQPKNQAATGFALRIESDFPIASVSVSHKPETVQSSTYNI